MIWTKVFEESPNAVVSSDTLKKIIMNHRQCTNFRNNSVEYVFEFENHRVISHINLKTGRILTSRIEL